MLLINHPFLFATMPCATTQSTLLINYLFFIATISSMPSPPFPRQSPRLFFFNHHNMNINSKSTIPYILYCHHLMDSYQTTVLPRLIHASHTFSITITPLSSQCHAPPLHLNHSMFCGSCKIHPLLQLHPPSPSFIFWAAALEGVDYLCFEVLILAKRTKSKP